MDKREKIILAALEEFVEHGYAGARIRDICGAAGVNLAAVNYYFGGKEELFKAVLEFSFSLPDPFEELKNDIVNETDPETVLFKLIVSFLKNTSSQSVLYRYRYRLIVREMLTPSRVFPEMFLPGLIPRFELMKQAIGKLRAIDSSAPELVTETLLFFAQCVFFFNKPVVKGVTGDIDFGVNHAEDIARRIIRSIKA